MMGNVMDYPIVSGFVVVGGIALAGLSTVWALSAFIGSRSSEETSDEPVFRSSDDSVESFVDARKSGHQCIP